MTTTSSHSFSDTVALLEGAIRDGGNTIFAVIDQAGAAAAVGLSLRPTTLIVFGNPRGGTPLMEAFPAIALDLPLKLLVWEEDGAVRVAHAAMSEIASRYGVTGMDARIAAMDRAVVGLLETVA